MYKKGREQQLPSLSTIMYNVRAWQRNGAVPVLYAMLAHGLAIKQEEVIPTFQAIVGSKIWDRLYTSERKNVITNGHYVPTQLGMIVRETLDRVRDKLDKVKDSQKSQELAPIFLAKHSADHAKKRKTIEENLDDLSAL